MSQKAYTKKEGRIEVIEFNGTFPIGLYERQGNIAKRIGTEEKYNWNELKLRTETQPSIYRKL